MLNQVITEVLRPLKCYKFITMFLCSVSILIGMLIPYTIGIILDEISRPLNYVLQFAGFIALILFTSFILNWSQNLMWFSLVYRSINLVRKHLYNTLVHKSIYFHREKSVGDLSNKLLNDVGSYAENRAILMPVLYLNLLRIGVVITFLSIMNMWLALVCSLLYLVYLGMYTRLNSKLRVANRRQSETYSVMQERTNETLINIETIHVYRAQNYFFERFGRAVDAHTGNMIKLQFWKSLGQSATNAALDAIPVAAIVLGIVFYQQGTITLGQIVAFFAFLPQLGEPCRNLADFNISYQSVKGLESRLEELLPDLEEDYKNKPSVEVINSIRIDNLNFSYDVGKAIFKDFNLSLRRGDVLGVSGPSGAGKSTLVKILMNLIEAEGVLYNDLHANQLSPESYLSRFALLPQEVFLFDAEITDNVTFGKSTGDIKKALSTSCAEHITGKPLSLSGGEKQRIGLARAIYINADVLILDEPTSALDEQTEKRVVENLRALLEKSYVITVIITHRPEILSLCTRVLTL